MRVVMSSTPTGIVDGVIPLRRSERASDRARCRPIGLPVGTRVWTADGVMPVEFLGAGDRIITRDSGIARLTGTLAVSAVHHLVRVPASGLGPQRPDQDVLLPVDQPVLLRGPVAQAFSGEDRAICRAGALGKLDLAEDLGHQPGTLITLHLDRRDVIYVSGLDVLSGSVTD